MGAGVAVLKEQLAKVDVQLAAPALTHDVREVLLAQKAALEEELKAAQAKKSAGSAAAGACSLLSSFSRAPPCSFPSAFPRTPPSPCISHNTLFDASPRPPFLQRRRPSR